MVTIYTPLLPAARSQEYAVGRGPPLRVVTRRQHRPVGRPGPASGSSGSPAGSTPGRAGGQVAGGQGGRPTQKTCINLCFLSAWHTFPQEGYLLNQAKAILDNDSLRGKVAIIYMFLKCLVLLREQSARRITQSVEKSMETKKSAGDLCR